MRYLPGFFVLLLFPPWAWADMVFAQLALGGGYECVLIVANTTDSDRVVWGYAFPDDLSALATWKLNGQQLPSDAAGIGYVFFAVGPKKTTKLVLTGGATTISGWLLLHPLSDDRNLAVSFFYNYYVDGRVINSTGSPASKSGYKIAFAVERSTRVDTGLAWACNDYYYPTTPKKPDITLTLLDGEGRPLQRKVLTKADAHKAIFFDQLFDVQLPQDFLGSVLIESVPMIYVTVLRIENNPDGTFLLTSTPPNSDVP